MRKGYNQLQTLFALLILANLILPSVQEPGNKSQGATASDRSEQAVVDKGTKPLVAAEAPIAAPSPLPAPHQFPQQKSLPKETEQPQPAAVGEVGTGAGGGNEAAKAAKNLTVVPPDQPDSDKQPPEAQVAGGEPSAADAPEEGDDIEEDRHNFALAKDGAKVISANKEAKKTGAVLDSDGDTFLKNECKADKWFIVELSQVTKMDTLVIAQNELYSSRMKEFEVRGRQSHPRTEGSDYSKHLNSSHWQILGRFEASNIKGTQAFKLENPSWLKYLLIRQLSHHGTEAVCALNDVCVYGKSAAEDLEDRLSQESPEEGTEIPAVPIPEVLEGDVPKLQQEGAPLVLEPHTIVSGENGSTRLGASATMGREVAAAGGGQTGDPEVQAEMIKVMPVEPNPLHQVTPPGLTIVPEAKKEAATKPGPQLPAQIVADKPELGLNEKREPEKSEKGLTGQGEAAKEVPHPMEGGNGGVSSNGGGNGGKAEDPLTANSAGSAASRHGGSIYDVIVQELKAIKLAQKDGSRDLGQLRANTSAVLGRLVLEVDMLSHRLNRLDPPVQALLPPGGAGAPVLAGGQGCAAREGEGLDFREVAGQCRNPGQPFVRMMQAPTELEVLQQEVARLHAMVMRSKRQGDALLIALALAFLGGLGVSAAFSAAAGRNLLRGALLLIGCVPMMLVAGLWLTGR